RLHKGSSRMTRLLTAVTGLAVVAGLVLVLAPSRAEEKELSIKEIMTKAHKKGTGILDDLAKDLKAEGPDWKEIKDHTKELVELGTARGKATPPKGEKASWEKQTTAYVDNAKAVDTATDKMDAKTATAALGKLQMSCRGCHMAHRVIK